MAVHGTHTRYTYGCRCQPCTIAHREAKQTRDRAIAYGRWDLWDDAAKVRAHITTLNAQGASLALIAQTADVPYRTVRNLKYRPTKKVRKPIAERILAVRMSWDLLPDSASVDSTGTVRRLQALGWQGHAQVDLAARLGVGVRHFLQIVEKGRTSAGLARRVRALCVELRDARPEGARADRVRRQARRRGWVPLFAWDDIDDPKARPRGVRKDTAA